MSSLRELAIAKLHSKAGQQARQEAGQQVSRAPETVSPRWDSKNGGHLGKTAGCLAVPLPSTRDSGTVDQNSGHSAGQQAGQSGILDERIAIARLREWHALLSNLDVYEPPDGFDQRCWAILVEDCCWLYETHASRLVRLGWSAMDLFGVMPSQRGWSGLADRLQSSRSLLIDDTGKAYWRRMGVSFELSRGVGEALRGSEARLVWELLH